MTGFVKSKGLILSIFTFCIYSNVLCKIGSWTYENNETISFQHKSGWYSTKAVTTCTVSRSLKELLAISTLQNASTSKAAEMPLNYCLHWAITKQAYSNCPINGHHKMLIQHQKYNHYCVKRTVKLTVTCHVNWMQQGRYQQ